MTNYIQILKKALNDPQVRIDCISYSYDPKLIEYVRKMSSNLYISEWRYGIGEIRYEYHIHSKELAKKLIGALKKGAHGGHPRLTAIYSKDKLEEIILHEVHS